MAFSLEPHLEGFLRALPKTETHLHLEGGLPWDLYQRVNREAVPPASWGNNFKYRDFDHFEGELLGMAALWYTSPERYHEAAKMQFEQLQAQNVRYIECSFASGMIEYAELDGRAVAQAITEAVPQGMVLRLFLGIHHNGCGANMRPVIEDALSWSELAGVDLHGREDFELEPWTAEIWHAAQQVGKFTKAHAGEFCGAYFIERILDELQPQRIQHGTRAAESALTLARLAASDIGLDMCPISNAKLMPGVSLKNHPIGKIMEAGVCVSVSTDDPLCFGNTLLEEYAVLHTHQGFDFEQLKQVARNGWQLALIDEPQREQALAAIDAVQISDFMDEAALQSSSAVSGASSAAMAAQAGRAEQGCSRSEKQ